jgi:hypothetical protein
MKMFPKPGTVLSKKKEEKNKLLNIRQYFTSTVEFKSYDVGRVL